MEKYTKVDYLDKAELDEFYNILGQSNSLLHTASVEINTK